VAIKSDIRDIGNRNTGTASNARQNGPKGNALFWNPKCESLDSSVGKMTTLETRSHRNVSSIPGKVKTFTAQLL